MANRSNRSQNETDLNVVMIPITVLIGVASWFLCNMLYSSMAGQVPKPVVIGIIFSVLYALLLIVVVIVSVLQHEYQGDIVTLLLALLTGTLLVFAVSTFFQFLYGLNLGTNIAGPSSYIFIIDDSGSTNDTDPMQLRYKAIADVLSGEEETVPYMVYSFSDTTYITREMGPAINGEQISGDAYGGTSIRGALEEAIDDFRHGVWEGGDSPKFVLLSDGYATDIDLFNSIDPVLDEYVDEGLSISTVGLGNADDSLMNTIAETTGGVYIAVSDAAELSNAMKTAAVASSDRDLVSNRHMRRYNGLFGFLRVLFITLIGTIMGFLVAYAYGNRDSYMISTAASAVLSLIGAVIMEVFTVVFHFNNKPVWMVLWAFLAATILLKQYTRHMGIEDLYRVDRHP